MGRAGSIRLLSLTCALITFLQGFCTVFAFTQHLLNNQQHVRHRRTVSIAHLQSRPLYHNVSSSGRLRVYPDYGPWGPWTESSQCSRSCGGGIAYQDRICLNVRADGRHSCVGPARRYFSCNTQECPPGSREFRDEQCARFNSVPYKGKYYSWVPYYNAQNPCELNCYPKSGTFYARLDSKVIDGTRCRDDGSLDVCVDAQCMPVGCDNILGSTLQEDECRVCGGDGSSCRVIKGIFDEDNFEVGYNDILLIPVGATSILIKEVQPTNNYFAIRNTAGKFYLNGDWKIEIPREIRIAGTIFHYERKAHAPEILRARGPTIEPIFIVLLYQETNIGISYEYSVPVTTKTSPTDSYTWTFGDFEECSQTCGGGVQYRPVRCIRKSDRDIVDDTLCDPLLKPEVNGSCNTQPCPSGWQIGEWSDCSRSCGGGTQFRLVFCHQMKDGSAILIADEMCDEPKPVFMRACNVDKECPNWVTDEWSECDASCGPGNETRSVQCFSKETNEVVDEALCDVSGKPSDFQECNLGPCEGVEWIVSDWSGCDGSCSPRMESREVHCANEDGVVFSDDTCDASKKPELTRACPLSTICDPMWHTSQWTECSVKCGHGVQSRVVFCGASQDDAVIKIDDNKCDPEKKFEEVQNCSAESCKGIWFTGPWNRCSVPCGGGERSRKILCFHEDEVVDTSQCNPAEEPFDKETCNMMPCDGDEIMTFGGCKDSKYGCCPDGMTPAGPNYEGCHKLNISSTNTSCEEAEFGCCADGFTLALGPFRQGCPSIINCNASKHGCCPDDKTAAKGPNFEGCAEDEESCENSTYGCCADGQTQASGLNFEGCPFEESNCTNTTFGCCSDGFTAASGPNNEGCDDMVTKIWDDDVSSGEDCYTMKYGCCPDGLTPADGPEQEGCENRTNTTKCETSAFGCCEDGLTPAEGPLKFGCLEDTGSGDDSLVLSCEETTFGCCPDNITAAKGFNEEGCLDCLNTTFGCCPDNIAIALGPDGEGCPDCSNSTFGCCADNITFALGPNEEGCSLEDCSNSTFGCCADNITFALGLNEEGCFLEDCSNSTFGCCADNVTFALGPNEEGCFLEDCSNSTFGCCADNVTFALGPNSEGCESGNCSASLFGCCPDNITAALGFDNEGCILEDCSNSSFGCCPDNITAAAGTEFEGCDTAEVDCVNSTYGCCPDNITFALGPDNEGCENETDCTVSPFGCCLDNVTFAAGPNFEGCNVTDITTEETTEVLPECTNTMFGCCPDEVTVALGPNLEGCCFGMRFGCCPDNKTAALGPTYLGCGCQTYPYGCCPDEITPAQGFNYQGCKCEHFRYGCCQDKITPATGPHFEGCVCQLMYYGCCPDGITPMTSSKGDGCGCDSTRYGCCPDGKTAAVSADLSGCPCETLPYGCCPDGHTPARTSDLRDCPCETQRYGCCLDGRTASRGPNYEGCPCESTRYGCCLDGKTTAQGPNFQGCPCETTHYGCCADGYTAALGPQYKGCPDVLPPKHKVSTEVCSLPRDAGPCRNFTVKWFFDVAYGGCSRFWYGGCDGNGNVFGTQEECEKVCVKPEGYDTCLLPKVAGSCDGKVPSWYYDTGSKACEAFTYGGCLGNNNRFASKTDCELKCITQKPITPVNKCSLPKDEGTCDNLVVQWFYNEQALRCEQFYYGGCKGNANRFETRKECEKSCLAVTTHEEDVCRLPQDIGPCYEFRERWYFDYEAGECHRFIFGGCDGNENNFGSFHECEKRCGKDASLEIPDQEFKAEYCFFTQDPGPCSNAELNWFYDSSDGVCKEFYYGGCKGNQNRFKTRKECEKSCFKAQDACNLAAVKGPCSGTFTQWYYDKSQDECFEFLFSGCQGNANRFNSKEICHQRCKKVQITTEIPLVSDDVCSSPQEPGPCLGYYRMWFYDGSENICKSFVYGGCEGNGNRFEKRSECEQRCVKKLTKVTPILPEPTKTTNEDVCRLPVEPGPCNEAHPRWFYDAQSQNCLPFVYGGCGGNKNRFKTSEICLRFCTGIKAKPSIGEIPFTPSPISTTVVPIQCPSSNCAEIQCPYGIEETFDTNGCSTCRCSNPCEVHSCPEGSRCAIDVVRTSQEGIRTEPVCRRVHKPGSCPSSNQFSSGPRDCETRCRDDADCRGEYKCCNNGCAFNCVPPAIPLAVHVNLVSKTPTAGSPAQIDCEVQGPDSGVTVTWKHNNNEILEDERRRILLNHTLFLTKAEVTDSGEYKCTATYDRNIATSSVYLTVNDSPTESTCVDSPQFNNCELIVKANYCNNKYYGKFCCGSCLKAGQLQDMPGV